MSWIDDEGKEHPRIKQELEVKNLRLNYKILDGTFTIEISDDANIQISDPNIRISNRKVSKKEFLMLYPAFNEE